jgi:hypothetical protein
MSSTVLLKRGKIDWIAVYVPKEAVLKEMAGKIEQVKPAFIFLFRELVLIYYDSVLYK